MKRWLVERVTADHQVQVERVITGARFQGYKPRLAEVQQEIRQLP